MGWTVIQLDRFSLGSRTYRFSDERRDTGRPVKVQRWLDERGWRDCANVDVSDAIVKAIMSGYVGIKMSDKPA